jgi:DNA-binding NarL/FixJ family response regulator
MIINERIADTEITSDGYLVITKIIEYEFKERYKIVLDKTRRPFEDLTRREMDVLECIAAGYTNREAAIDLHLSIRTVESHRANIMGKLGVSSRRDLVNFWKVNYEYQLRQNGQGE